MTLAPGQILKERYRIVKLLGQGGFGAVYRAWDLTFEATCAVKENFETGEAAQRQFLREARLLHNLRHPNLPQVKDYFVVSGRGQYLVMDYVEGEDLDEKLDQAGESFPEAQVLDWAGQICEALSYLHSQNPPVIHRDIKPANIKLTPDGRAMLVDFGIAKLFDPNLKTTAGAQAVTPGYSPPEQYGAAATDPRSDVYSLGATLYHLLTGIAPPPSVDIVSGVAAAPRPAGEVNPQVSPPVSAAIGRAMQLNREARFGNAGELRQALVRPSPPAPLPARERGAGGRARTQVVQPDGASSSSYGPPPEVGGGEVATPGRRLPWKWIGAGAALSVAGIVLGSLLVAVLSGGGRALATQTSLAQLEWGATNTPRATITPSFTPTSRQPSLTPPRQVPSLTPIPTRSPTATPTDLPQRIFDAQGAEMALVPAGEFQMGSEDGDEDEKPVHTVYLDAYYMDVYEVTNAVYEKCVQAAACSAPDETKSYTRSSYYGNSQFDDYPVVYVSWEQARTFCEWRGARLPTEAEWEKAARGGLEGELYPWGGEAPTCQAGSKNGAQYSSCSPGDTIQVGSYAPNAYGLFDMAGNVLEWVEDWYDAVYYSISPASNPTGPSSGSIKVQRGGGWYNPDIYLRVAYRADYSIPISRSIGFRCVATVKLP